MAAFEDGQRVRYVGIDGLGSKWKGREGVVEDSYRDFDGNRVLVMIDGEDHAVSFDEEDFEAVRSTYEIENDAEDSAYAEMDLTDPEFALVQRVFAELNRDRPEFAPTISIKRKETK